MSKMQILLVDDEPMVLKVLGRVFSTNFDCDITTAANGQEALDLMEGERFDIIVSDMMMPIMDGAALLNVVQELYPKTARFVMSARSGESFGLETAGSVHQYFMKPSDVNMISDRVNRVFELRKRLPKEGIDHVITQVKSLPSLPHVYLELEKEIKKPSASVESVGKILEQDVSMSAKVLQLVNSAFFGLREHVAKPSQAAMLLGLDVIKSFVLAIHVFSKWQDQQVSGFSINELWTHSLNTANAAKQIAALENVDKNLQEEIYISGLFHDIGKLIFADNIPDSYANIQKLIKEENMDTLAAEKEVLGATHADAGGYLLSLWGFSDDVISGALFHHAPSEAGNDGFSSALAVHVANVLDHQKSETKSSSSEIDELYIQEHGFAERMPVWIESLKDL